MPTANRQQWIPMAIACFLNQTFTDLEIVVVDDGTEPTAVLDDSRIRYIRLEPGKRPTGMKRNICCQEARGEIIVHGDDDDWSAPNRIESQLAFMQETGKPFVGYHSISYWNTAPGLCSDTKRAFRYVGRRPYASGTSQCYLRSYWEKNKFQEKIIGEDSDFSRRGLQSKQLDSQDGTQMIVARTHPNNTCPVRLGGHQFPQVKLSDMPAGFLTAMGVTQ